MAAIETNMVGYSHAALSLLEKIDDVHYRFLRDLEVSSSDAFLEHAFAPPSLFFLSMHAIERELIAQPVSGRYFASH